jgi:putative endonuclease
MKKENHLLNDWTVYLLECKDGSFYTGITIDLDQRIAKHNAGMGAKYTRGRSPVKLLEHMQVNGQSTALQIEAKIKKLPKSKKRAFFKETTKPN